MVLSSYPSSRLKCSLSNPQSMIMMSSPQPTVALLFPVRLGGAASFAEFRGLRIQMGSKFSTSLVSINTRRNPKVFSRMVSEAQDTVVDRKFGVGRGQGRWSLRSREKPVRSGNELVSFPLSTHRYIKSCRRHFLLLFCDFIKSRKVFL
ncbi:hypothetical protein NC652_031799 [Populus alba x Populus x berolinensis]|nr:hypothetical protein NC652_031799 [Populus alba x Populus x berolinensis]